MNHEISVAGILSWTHIRLTFAVARRLPSTMTPGQDRLEVARRRLWRLGVSIAYRFQYGCDTPSRPSRVASAP